MNIFAKIVDNMTNICMSFIHNGLNVISRKDQIIGRIASGIVQTAEQCGSAVIRTENNKVAYWTGNKYIVPSKDDHRRFLHDAAVRAGVTPDEASTKRFLDMLEAQIQNMPSDYFTPDRDTRYDLLVLNFTNFSVHVDPYASVVDHPLSREILPTVSLPFEYAPGETCPIFQKYLETSLPDIGTREALMEYIACCLIPFGHVMDPNVQKCAVLVGPRDSGKTVLTTILDAFFGEFSIRRQLATITQPDSFLRSDLEGKLLCISNDVDNRISNKELFKSLVTGEPVEADRKHKAAKQLTQYARLMIVGNTYPSIFADDPAFFKRILPIPFKTSIPEDKQDRDLARKIIKNELPGIANWVLESMQNLLQAKTFTFSQAMADELASYQLNAAHVNEFLQAEGYVQSAIAVTSQAKLFAEYRTYCLNRQYSDMLPSSTAFGRAMKALGHLLKIIDNQNYFNLTNNPSYDS